MATASTKVPMRESNTYTQGKDVGRTKTFSTGMSGALPTSGNPTNKGGINRPTKGKS